MMRDVQNNRGSVVEMGRKSRLKAGAGGGSEQKSQWDGRRPDFSIADFVLAAILVRV